MPESALRRLVALHGRRGRGSYCLAALALAGVALGAVLPWPLFARLHAEAAAGLWSNLAVATVLAATVASLTLAAQRCRDLGWSGWAALGLLVPGLGLVFALALAVLPGDRGENRFGRDPRAAPPMRPAAAAGPRRLRRRAA